MAKKKRPTWRDKIEARVESEGWGVRELAARAGISAMSLSRYVRGQRGLTAETLERLAAALGFDLSHPEE